MIRRVLIIYTVGFLASLFLYSCCTEIYRTTTNFQIAFTDLMGDTVPIVQEDTITGAFEYTLQAEVIREVVDLSQLSLIQSTYAYSCDMAYEDSFVPETASVTLNKNFMIDDHIVEAGTNLLLLDLEGRGVPYRLTEEEYITQVGFAHVRIIFRDSLLDRLHFPLQDYTFRTVVELENGERIISEESRTIFIP